MPTIRVIYNGTEKDISFEGDKTLSQVLSLADAYVEHPCGGKGSCKKCTVLVDGKETLACQYHPKGSETVTVPEKKEILSVSGTAELGEFTDNVCLCLDIGTTTLALALVSLDEGKTVRVVTATNPQRAYGADIMTRIDYCHKNSVAELHSCIIAEIADMVKRLGISAVKTMYVSGNATMLHLFFGIDCSSIGVAPYTPVFLDSKTVNGAEIGLDAIGKIISLPSISSFVGADIVAGLGYIGVPKEGSYSLLVDLGTNAEIVLYSSKRGVATAAAAGPCFEGANISCGMSATDGAVYAFDNSNGYAAYKTISDCPPKGICGTGLIDMIAALVSDGTIDETGFMEDDEYILSEGVSITAGDVRQYQLAKSAVCSAIQTLMKIESIGFEDIDTIYISGGFSAHINIKNAVKSGLFPPELENKTVALNNSSLLGTIKHACENVDFSKFLDSISYVDLSDNPYFSDLFIENMMFE